MRLCLDLYIWCIELREDVYWRFAQLHDTNCHHHSSDGNHEETKL